MKRAGVTAVQKAEVVVAVALIALAGAYAVAAQQRAPPSSTLASSSALATSVTSSPAPSGTASTSSPYLSSSSSSGSISHVIVVLMENEEYGSVIGSPSAPYENSLAANYALAANYTGVAHPSLPNYLALVSGSTFGVTTDCFPAQCSLPSSVPTVASLLDAHHLSWMEFAQSMPTNCSQLESPDGLYLPKHDPFVYFGSVTGNDGTGATSAYCDSHVVSLSQFYLDLASGGLPNYSFVTPNMCNDGHSCPLSTGDHWLSTFVPRVINSSAFSSTAMFIVYDEGSPTDLTGGGGYVACLLVSPFAKPGYVSHVSYSHYSLLATVETIFGLGNMGRNDATASPMSDLFAGGLP
ncbi:MAG: hypothetical protein JRN58_05240 [Nitrososphaerota archaeon]|nr:hypothetical protein [Nitrososphaerota archaeon]MDG6978468.1 hypothetical protein [Nitrososphaerota archaeon]